MRAVLLLLLVTSCSRWDWRSESSDQDTTKPFSLEILETRGCPLPEGVKEEDTRILGVRVRITGHHPAGVPANYYYGSVLTEDQDRYLAGLPGCEPVLHGAPLEPGQEREGFLNFPLPLAKHPQQVVYAPLVGELASSERSVQRPLAPEESE